MKDRGTDEVIKAADYSQLGKLLIVQVVIVLILPLAAIVFVRIGKARTT